MIKDINSTDPEIRSVAKANLAMHCVSVNDIPRRTWMDWFTTLELCEEAMKDSQGVMDRTGYGNQGREMLSERIRELKGQRPVALETPESAPITVSQERTPSQRPLTKPATRIAPVALQKVTTNLGVFHSLDTLKQAMLSAYPLIDSDSMGEIFARAKSSLTIDKKVDFLSKTLYTKFIVKVKSSCEDNFILSMGGDPNLLTEEDTVDQKQSEQPEEAEVEEVKKVGTGKEEKPFIIELEVEDGAELPAELDVSFDTYKGAQEVQKRLNKIGGVKAKAKRRKS